jgi:hypothetical protein
MEDGEFRHMVLKEPTIFVAMNSLYRLLSPGHCLDL